MAHSEYLAAEIDADRAMRLTHVSAPVFDAAGDVTVSIMLLGPNHEASAQEIAALGELVADAATAATQEIGGHVTTRHRSP